MASRAAAKFPSFSDCFTYGDRAICDVHADTATHTNAAETASRFSLVLLFVRGTDRSRYIDIFLRPMYFLIFFWPVHTFAFVSRS